jgi:hypothetical protein
MPKKDWNPAHAHVVILGLGLDEWADPDDPSWKRHETLAALFRKAGVPESQVHFWLDDEGAGAKMKKRLPKILSNMEEDGVFVFYYAGHGDLDPEWENELYFCHPDGNDDVLYGSELIDFLEEHFEGERAVIFADCCHSGWLARAVAALDTEAEYVALTSSTADVTSTGNWTFTDCLISALRGENGIDFDENGAITFHELARHVREQMQKVDRQPADFAHTSAFDPGFRIAVVR